MATRDKLIATRAAADKKARFVELASRRGMNESALLTLLIDTVLEDNDVATTLPHENLSGPPTVRITLRLRPGDRALVDERARARNMRTSTYLVTLIRAHVRCNAPIPMAELNVLKATAHQLSLLNTQLRQLVQADEGRLLLEPAVLSRLDAVHAVVRDARREVSEIVRVNLVSWEAGDD